jgi:uncharacterized protein YecT (DUF1311 family)
MFGKKRKEYVKVSFKVLDEITGETRTEMHTRCRIEQLGVAAHYINQAYEKSLAELTENRQEEVKGSVSEAIKSEVKLYE